MVIPGHSPFKVLSNTCIVSSLKDVWSMTDKKVSFLLMCVDSYRMLVQGFINIWRSLRGIVIFMWLESEFEISP